MKAFVYNSIETIPGRCDFTLPFRGSSDQSAPVESTTGSTQAASPPMVGGMDRKRYVGPIAHLRGKTALVEPRVGTPGEVMAQFEEVHLQEARGWWQFSWADFEILGSLRQD